MKDFQTTLLKVREIEGMFYKIHNRKTSKLVIYGIGAPLPPDNGMLQDAPFILNFDVDLFVPDYIGFGRSNGIFTPKNCIKTFSILFDVFKKGTIATNGYLNKKLSLQYDEILFIGRSFGGMYITWLPKLNPLIKNLCLIFPILDYVACGKISGEETTNGFMKAMNQDGYQHLYRGINRPFWIKHFLNEDGLCPMDNIEHLSLANVFIAHGKQDENINFSHSVNFHKKLITQFPNRTSQFRLQLYEGKHTSQVSNKAIVDFLKWMKIPKAFNN